MHTVSPQQHRAIRHWFIFSTILLSSIIIIITWFEIKQVRRLTKIKTEKKALAHHAIEYTTFNTRKNVLNEQYNAAQKQQVKITKHQKNPKNPHALLSTITHACTQCGIKLVSLNVTKNNLELQIHSTQSETILNLINKLNQSPLLQNIILVSLRPAQINQKTNNATLMGTITGKRRAKL